MVAFHPHQEMLASASSDGTVRLWSLHKVEQAGVESHPTMLPATSPVVYDLAFSPDGRVLACAGAELTLRFWDVTESQPTELIAARKRVREASEQDIFAVAFSPDGKKLACGGNNVLHLWDLPDDYFDDIDQNTGQDIEQVDSPLILRHHTTWIYSIAFSPDSTLLASCSADCTVCLWDAASGNLRHILIGHTEAIFKVAFNLDGATVLSCSFDGTIKFWDVQTGVCVNTLAVDGPYAGMNIHEMTGITEAQKVALKALGAVEQS
jgi:WD40 repeat protein